MEEGVFKMNNFQNTPFVLSGHKPCIPKRSRVAPFTEAAKSLLSSPLPPELVVDFKGLVLGAPTPSLSSSSPLRSSSSETNLNQLAKRASKAFENDHSILPPAFRTLSEGGHCNFNRRTIESEDSSYDSDCDCSGSRNSGAKANNRREIAESQNLSTLANTDSLKSKEAKTHPNVSRSISDTLVAEFNEYVNLPESVLESKEPCNGELDFVDRTSADTSSCQSYTSRVEFALKLGYEELQVQKALAKLGPQTTQNELLAELIRLTALSGNHAASASAITSTSVPEFKTSLLQVHKTLCLTNSEDGGLRHIVIDGSNVAFSHGNKEVFSCRGIQLCVDWFRTRGHLEITVFVPRWRKEAPKTDTPISGQEILLELEKERILVFTPSRQVGGRRLVCYDDRYCLQLAAETDGIIVSNDNYRDLVQENPGYRKIVEERILMYSFVNDRFMPPEDPLGRNGPKLDVFLRKISTRLSADSSTTLLLCPYEKKCTYGNKCKYYHPERGNLPQKSVTERLVEQTQNQLVEVKTRLPSQTMGISHRSQNNKDINLFKTLSLPGSHEDSGSVVKQMSPVKKKPLARTRSIIPASQLASDSAEEQALAVTSREPIDSYVLQSDLQKGLNLDCFVNSSSTCSGSRNVTQVSHHASSSFHNLPPPTFNIPPPTLESCANDDSTWHWSSAQLRLCHKLSDPPSTSVLNKRSSEASETSDATFSLRPLHHLDRDSSNQAQDPRVFGLRNLAPPYPPPPPFGIHSVVTRNASAPAANSQKASRAHERIVEPHRAHRLNSTSDTQLNLCGGSNSSDFQSSADWGSRGICDPFDENALVAPSQSDLLRQPIHVHHQWASRTTSLPSQQRLSSSISPSSLSGKTTECESRQAAHQEFNKTEIREKLYYHLAAIFPEQRVRQVMQRMPYEVDAQKICAAILAFYPT